jgi:hypothetical protein
VSLWRNIRNGWGSFSNFLSYKVGDGSHISFWHDVWCGIEPLRHSFSEHYSIARNKEASMPNYMDLSSSFIHWNPSFIRVAHDWELKSFDSFFSVLYSSKTHPGEVDNLLWTTSSSQKFTVKSYYTLLQSSEHSSFPWRSVWKVKAPHHVAFFLWTAALDRILKMNTLRKRDFSLANWCCLRKKNEEMTNHLLIHCEYTSAFWQLILNLFEVS